MNETRRMPGRGSLIVTGAGLITCLVALWTFARPLPEIIQHRRHFSELRRQVAAARASKGARASERGRVMRLRAQARTSSGAQREAFERDALAAESHLGWGDRAVVRSVVLASPLLTLRQASAPTDVVPVFSAARSTCAACHVAIATSGFEKYPAPFRTHPKLASYVGAASPHEPSRVECVACHRGDEHATSYAAAGHPLLQGDMGPAGGGMLRVEETEAGCVACHAGELYQPGAPRLNEALVTVERAGCYACHIVPGMERTAKRGPDLRRIKGKVSPAWVRQWLANPRAIKPATWMPRFWWEPDVLPMDQRAEIDAVVAYLFGASDDYSPAVPSPPRGDAARGEQLVTSVGCLGCHVVGDVDRDKTSLRRTFGQPLQAIANKTTYAWLVDWVREPSRYSPDTRMPSLRLSATEAADVATYLQTLSSPLRSDGASPLGDDAPYRAVLIRYGPGGQPAPSSELTGAALREAAGKAVISALGCFNCHEIRGFEDQRTSVAIPARAQWRPEDGPRLHEAPSGAPGGRPGFVFGPRRIVKDAPGTEFGSPFGEAEQSRLLLAMTAVAGPIRETHGISMPWQLTKVRGRQLVQERNCVGCHAIDDVGGDFLKLVADPTLGPPLLTPEGSRVQPDWLRAFLHQPKTIRPWLSVRMPTFGLSEDDAGQVGRYFSAIAPPNPAPTGAPTVVTAAAGKGLFELLKCQQCHVLGTIPKDQPTSNLAPDLRMARERLQPEWILAWLRSPSAVLPGTRMPTFWPDYPKSFYAPFDRDGAVQVRAIRDHLLTLH